MTIDTEDPTLPDAPALITAADRQYIAIGKMVVGFYYGMHALRRATVSAMLPPELVELLTKARP